MVNPPYAKNSESEISSLGELHEAIARLTEWYNEQKIEVRTARERGELGSGFSEHLLFRGHTKASWTLSSTLERSRFGTELRGYSNWVRVVRPQIEAFTDRRWGELGDIEIADWFRTPNAGGGRSTVRSLVLYLRHHGFPSPLIDWSQSPYIAAYFAVRDHIRMELDDDPAVHILLPLAGGILEAQSRLIQHLGPVVDSHPRHFLQKCEYTWSVTSFGDEYRVTPHEDALLDPGNGSYFTKLRIAKAAVPEIGEFLLAVNLNAYSLFSTPDSQIAALVEEGPPRR